MDTVASDVALLLEGDSSDWDHSRLLRDEDSRDFLPIPTYDPQIFLDTIRRLRDYLRHHSSDLAEVSTAVLDTGVRTDHALLRDFLTESISLVPNESPEDFNGHGTSVAGLLLVHSIGRCRPRLVNIKVLDGTGRGTERMLIEGIRQAIARKVDVINLSAGIPRTGIRKLLCQGTCELCRTAAEAGDAGILVCVAAGNNRTTHCPATIAVLRPESNVIAVAEADPDTGRLTQNSAPGNVAHPTGSHYRLTWPPTTTDLLGMFVTMARRCMSWGKISMAADIYREGLATIPKALNPSEVDDRWIESLKYEATYGLGRCEYLRAEYRTALEQFRASESQLQAALSCGESWPLDLINIDDPIWAPGATPAARYDILLGTVREMLGLTLLKLERYTEAVEPLRQSADSIRWWSGENDRLRRIEDALEVASGHYPGQVMGSIIT